MRAFFQVKTASPRSFAQQDLKAVGNRPSVSPEFINIFPSPILHGPSHTRADITKKFGAPPTRPPNQRSLSVKFRNGVLPGLLAFLLAFAGPLTHVAPAQTNQTAD